MDLRRFLAVLRPGPARLPAPPRSTSACSPPSASPTAPRGDDLLRLEAGFLRQTAHQLELISAVFEAVPDALLLIDAEQQIVMANPAASRLFGHAPEVLLGSAPALLFADNRLPPGLAPTTEPGAAASAIDEPPEVHACRRADGTELLGEIRVTSAREADGAAIGRLVLIRDVTERERQQQALDAQRRRLQDMIETMADVVWEVDADGRYTFISAQVEDLFGEAPQAFIGTTPFEHMPADEARRVAVEFQAISAAARPFRDLESICLHRDGSRRILSTSGVPVHDVGGRLLGYRGIGRNITDSRRRETELRMLLDAIPDLIFFKDDQGRYVECNAAFERFLGRSREAILGATDRDLFEAQVAAFFREQDAAMLAAGRPRRNDEWVDYPDGGRVLLDTFKTPYQPNADTPPGVLGISRDVTAQHWQARDLARAQDIAGIGSGFEDLRSGEVYWSPNLYRILGLEPDSAQPGNAALLALVHPDDRERVRASLLELPPRRADSAAAEFRILRPDGELRWIEGRREVIRDSSGEPTRIEGVARDITEHYRAELALAQSEQRYRTMFEAVGRPLLLTDADGRISAANRAACRLLGYAEPDALLGVPIQSLSPSVQPDGEGSADKAVRLLDDTLSQGSLCFDWDHLRRDGSLLPVEVTLNRVELGGGTALLVSWYDLTDRRRAEAMEVQARAVFDNTVEGITITDADNRIQMVNPAFTRITGYSLEEVRGQPPGILASGKHDRGFYQAMWQALTETGSWRGEIWNRRKDGELYVEWLSISVIRDADGNILQHIGVFSDITEAHRTAEQIEQLTHYDPLTGLPNLTLLRARLDQALRSAQVAGLPAALLLLNLDGFQRIIATGGHEAGDRALRAVADGLRAELPADATLARITGDTFAVVLELDQVRASPDQLARRMQQALRRGVAPDDAGRLALSCCIGVALYPTDAGTSGELLRDAESALHEAKAAGAGAIAYYQPAMTEAAARRVALEQALRDALERDELELHFQPQLDLEQGAITGAEALIRWRRSDGTLLPPAAFMTVVETSDLVHDVGRWVLREALCTRREWQDAGLAPVRVSINVSGAMITVGGLAELIRTELAAAGIAPAALEIEVLENMLFDDPRHAQAELQAVRALGVSIALDDFGTGYSSLGYLKRFPIDHLKIDRSFIQGLAPDSDDMAIVRSTVAMAHHLGIGVVAEGVSDDAQINQLAALGCDLLQGYRIGEPMPKARFAALLTSRGAASLSAGLRHVVRRRLLLTSPDAGLHRRLAAALEPLGWTLLSAASSADALDLLGREQVYLLLAQGPLEDAAALELLEQARRRHPGVVRVLVAEDPEPALITDAFDRGVIHRLLRPSRAESRLGDLTRSGYELGLMLRLAGGMR